MRSVQDLADGALDGTQLELVELTTPAARAAIDQARAAAEGALGPVVGICQDGLSRELEPLAGSLSCTLTTGLETGPTTVQVEDMAASIAAIHAVCRTAPAAASTLAQLLRLTSALSVPEGLIAESLAYSMLLGGSEFAAWRRGVVRRQCTEGVPPLVQLTRAADALHVTLNRPDRHNAFSRAVRDELNEALSLALADGSISEVHLRGNGPSFCSGGDLDEFGTAHDLVEAHHVRIATSAGLRLHLLSERLTAHLHGACIGAGIEIAAFAHRVVVEGPVHIQLVELPMGLVPGAGGTVSLPKRIGRWRTAYLALSAAPIDSATALRWGLVDAVRPQHVRPG
jgi:enoyl-CoA hydratase/carnithine racemase